MDFHKIIERIVESQRVVCNKVVDDSDNTISIRLMKANENSEVSLGINKDDIVTKVTQSSDIFWGRGSHPSQQKESVWV